MNIKKNNNIINMMVGEKVVDSTEIAIDKISEVVGGLAKELAEQATNEVIDTVIDTVIGAGVGDGIGDVVGDVVGDIDVGDFIETVVECVSEEILNSAIIEVRHQLGTIGIKPTTLSIIIKHVMEVVENTPVKGKNQLNYAILIISDLVNELEDGDEKTLLINMIDNGSIKDTIELVVDASKGNLKINKIVEVVADGCLGPCFKYMTPF